MYTQRMRGSEPLVLPGRTDRRDSNGGPTFFRTWETTVQQYVEYVYSWRTGSLSESDVAPSDSSLYGIKQPKTKGSLIEQLADRKRYYEDVMRAAFPAEDDRGVPSTNRVSQTDNGHRFSKVTALRYPAIVRAWTDLSLPATNYAYAVTDSLLTLAPPEMGGTPGVPNDSWISYPFAKHTASLSTADNRQGTANSFFAATAPERATAHLLTTAIELMRGDVPSLLKNYRRALFDYQNKYRSLNYVGNEFLNIQFGWQPLIAEYANMIRVFIGLDRMVYAESNRRKRRWDGPSTSVTRTLLDQTLSNEPLSGGSGERFQVTTSPGNFGADMTHPVTVDTTATVLRKEDYNFTARYSSLVKPNARSNGFVERAEDTLRQLGLVDDPSVLWELTPWSWLIDWAANIGESIVNAHTYSPLSGRHSVDYAYFTTQLTEVMDGSVDRLIKQTNPYWANRSVVVRPKAYYSTVTRTRDRATPFGFGTQLGDISNSQFAILVALGLARRR